MSSIQSEARKLVQAILEHLEDSQALSPLASKEDCDDFRLWASRIGQPQEIKKTTVIPREISKEIPQDPPAAKAMPPKPKALPSEPEPLVPPKRSAPPISRDALPVLEDSFSDLRKVWMKINPHSPLFDSLPDDEVAKKIASRWKAKNVAAEVSILSYHEPPAQKALLEQIAGAINVLLKPAQIVAAEPIEKEKQWEAFLAAPHLKWLIACDYTLWQLGGLMHHYRETPSRTARHLGSTPVFLLPDLSLYLKDPLLKRSLWKALCQTLCS